MTVPLANAGPLAGRTVLFAPASPDQFDSDRTLVECVEAVVRGGGRAVVAPRVRSRRSGRALLERVRPDVVYVDTVSEPLWIGAARRAGVPVLTPVTAAERGIARPVHGPAEQRTARTTLDGGLRILFVGQFTRHGGAGVAIDALGRLVDNGVEASLDLVGTPVPGTERHEAALVLRVAALGLIDRVRLYGQTTDVWPHLGRADVVVLPTLVDEPFVTRAVEALLAARPVVASNLPGIRRAAGGYLSTRFVMPGDPAALAWSLAGLRQRWETVRIDAALDAVTANDRHSPEGYRRAVSDLLVDLTPGVPAAGDRVYTRRAHVRNTARLTRNEV